MWLCRRCLTFDPASRRRRPRGRFVQRCWTALKTSSWHSNWLAAALAASGTVTLELGLAGVPMVVAYQVDIVAARLRPFIKAQSMVLANLVIGRNVFPEFVQEDVNGETLAGALTPLLADTPVRTTQLRALAEIPARLQLTSGTPSEAAAEIVLRYAEGTNRL